MHGCPIWMNYCCWVTPRNALILWHLGLASFSSPPHDPMIYCSGVSSKIPLRGQWEEQDFVNEPECHTWVGKNIFSLSLCSFFCGSAYVCPDLFTILLSVIPLWLP